MIVMVCYPEDVDLKLRKSMCSYGATERHETTAVTDEAADELQYSAGSDQQRSSESWNKTFPLTHIMCSWFSFEMRNNLINLPSSSRVSQVPL